MASVLETLDKLKAKRSRVNRRLRSKAQLIHRPTGRSSNKGKWHDVPALWAYKKLARRKRQIAAESRRRNRHA